MDVPLSCIIIVICLIGHFFFSACETSLACANRFKMQIEADNGKKSAKLVLKICEKYDRTLSAILIGNNIVAVAISAVSTLLFYQILSSDVFSSDVISLISSLCMTFLVYIFGDTLPKTIAKAIPDTISKAFVYPMYFVGLILFPIAYLFELFVKWIEKTFKVKNEESFTEEDFENLVEKVEDEGLLEEEQAEIIQSALDFVDTNVQEVLTPKDKIYALNIRELSHHKVHEIIDTCKFSRIPVYDTYLDNIIGILNVKTYFIDYLNNQKVSIRKTLQKPYFVSNKIMIDDLFNGFKKHHTHIAIVRDRNKKVIGMVTMEDVLEELVTGISEPTQRKVGK